MLSVSGRLWIRRFRHSFWSGCGGRAEPLLNLDLLTFAGHRANVRAAEGRTGYRFVHGDIGDASLVATAGGTLRPAIVDFAAETHVDRSIDDRPVRGDQRCGHFAVDWRRAVALAAGPDHWRLQGAFRFLHVSTDEVFGTLSPTNPPSAKTTSLYNPDSPYSASKAAVRSFCPRLAPHLRPADADDHCSNNYGPRQFPEKLIPLMILNALTGKPLPVYGDGQHVRDWLYVEDHCAAIRARPARGAPGETYNVGGASERTPTSRSCSTICANSTGCNPSPAAAATQPDYPCDRPAGHDRRYAMTSPKIAAQFGLAAFASALPRVFGRLSPGISTIPTGCVPSRAEATANGSNSNTRQRWAPHEQSRERQLTQGHRPGRGPGTRLYPGDSGHLQAAAPGLRQAHGVLPPVHPHAGRGSVRFWSSPRRRTPPVPVVVR